MEKSDGLLIILASIFAIFLIILIFVYMDSRILSPPASTKTHINFISNHSAQLSNCEMAYGVPNKSLVFIYSQSCPVCHVMLPKIKEVEAEGYKVFYAETTTQFARELINNCYKSIYTGYVPLLICAGPGNFYLGGMTKEAIKRFAERCVHGTN